MVTTVNSIGAAFQLVYIILFITYTDKRKKVVYSFRITQSCLCGGVLDSPLCCSKMFIHLCTPRMFWAGEDVWAADGRYCLILSHSCWELGNKWLYHSADGCWVLELCCSHIYVCFSIVCNCKCLKRLFHSRWMVGFLKLLISYGLLIFFFNYVYLAEFGDPDKKCRIHAILSFSFNFPNERFFSCLWNFEQWSLCLCKLPYLFHFTFLKLLLCCTKFALMFSNNMDALYVMHVCM